MQGALLSSCQGLCGPWAGAPAKRTGTVLLSCCIPVKEAYGKEGVWQGVGWTRVELGLECDCRLPPLFSCLVPFCPASRGAAGQQMHLPEIHTLGPDAYPPHLQGFTEMLHVPHTGVHLHSFKRAQRDIRLYSTSPWNFEPTN